MKHRISWGRVVALLMAVMMTVGMIPWGTAGATDVDAAVSTKKVEAAVKWSGSGNTEPAGLKLKISSDDGDLTGVTAVQSVSGPSWTCSWDVPAAGTYAVALEADAYLNDYTVVPTHSGESWVFTLTKKAAQAPGDEYVPTTDPTEGTSHPSTKHLGSCSHDATGYTCGFGSTIEFKLSPRTKDGRPLTLSDATELKLVIDGDPNLTKTVKYTSGEIVLSMRGIMPGSRTVHIEGTDSGAYAFEGVTYDEIENWFTRTATNGTVSTLSGNKIGEQPSAAANSTLSMPTKSSNPDKLYLDNLSVWAYPTFKTQTTTVQAMVDIKGYETADRDKLEFEFVVGTGDVNSFSPLAGQERKTANKANNWTVKWENLPYGTYSVQRADTREVGTGDNIKFTEEKLADNITVKATVSWPGFEAKDIPSSVTLELRDAEGKPYETQTVGSIYKDGWSYTWTVPRGDYTVVEKNPPAGVNVTYDMSVSTSRNMIEWAVVNSKADSKSVTLTWSGFGTTVPAQAVQIVLRDSTGAAVKTETLNAANGWSVAWTDLDPNEYYTLEETTTGNWTAVVTRTGTGWHITNYATMSVTATLTWSGYTDGNYPVDTVYVQLYNSRGRAVGSEVALTAARGWRYTWSDLEVDDYTVLETTTGSWKVDYKVSGGSSSSSGSGTNASKNMTVAITNTKTNTATVSVKVAWSGFGTDSEPVDYVRMVLKDQYGEQYGGAVQVRSSAGWTYTWKDLPQGEYTVEQTTTGNWTTVYKQSGTSWTVTNTKSNTLSVTAKVAWSGYSNESDHPSSVMLKLTQTNAPAGSSAAQGVIGVATKENNWTYTWTDLQDGGTYNLEETTTGDWNVEYSRAANGKSEVWTVKNTKASGTGTGTTTPPSGSSSLSVHVDWTKYGEPSVDSVTLQLVDSAGAVVATGAATKANSWNYTFSNLESGKAYSVRESTTGDWTATVSQSGSTGWIISHSKGGGSALGPNGNGTSAAGGDNGTGTGSNTTIYSNPPKTGDSTMAWLGCSFLMAAVVTMLVYKRRQTA